MNISSIGVIGYGDFGTFLHKLTKEMFPQVSVKISSTKRPLDGVTFFPFEEVCKTDILVLAVPISAFGEVLDRALLHLGEHTMVVDVATVKKHTADILKRKKVPRFIATHPMFGPYSYAKQGHSLTGLRIAVCANNLPKEDYTEAIKFLRRGGLSVLELTPEEHDQRIAETLFLTHLIGQTIKRGEFVRTSVDTVSFGFLMDAVESVANDEALFYEVFKYNPYCQDVLKRLERAEKNVISSLLENNA